MTQETSPIGAEIRAALDTYHTEVKTMAGDIDAIRKHQDDLSKKIARMMVGGGGPAGGDFETREALDAFRAFMRTGEAIETRDMKIAQDSDGGFMLPDELDRMIQSQVKEISPIRRLATVVRTRSLDYRRIVNRRGASSGWAGESTTRSETDTPSLAQIQPPSGELFADPKVTNWLLDDAAFDVADFLRENVVTEFAYQEGAAFISGNGINKPRGFLSGPTPVSTHETDSPPRAFGTLQYIPSGASGAFPAQSGIAGATDANALITLVHSVTPGYRQGPGVAWLMNSTTAATIRKMRDGQGNYVWQNSLRDGQPNYLLGYPVVEAEDMPDIAADSFPIAFGNWPRGYLITDRTNMTVIRDQITVKGSTSFYFAKRVGGHVTDTNALKLLKMSAS